MDFIIKIYKSAPKIKIFNKFGSIFQSNKLSQALKYYYFEKNNYSEGITVEGIRSGSILIFISTFIISNLVLFLINYYISLIISLLLSFLFARKSYYYLIDYFKQQNLDLLQLLDVVYQDLLMILDSNSSVLDAIQFIALSNYPIISRHFKILIQRINTGENPEDALIEYTNIISNNTFQQRIYSLLGDKYQDSNHIKDANFSIELLSEYRSYTRQLETRLTIILGVNLFLPVLSSTLLGLFVANNIYLIYSLLPFHFLLMIISKKFLLKREFFIFGENYNNSNEFNELLIFFKNFSNLLQMNSPEISFIKSSKLKNLNSTKQTINNISRRLIIGNLNFKKALKMLSFNIVDRQSRILLKMINEMISKNTYEAGFRLKNTVDNILKIQEFINEREIILKSNKFKIIIMAVIMSSVLGLMTNLIPMMIPALNMISSVILPNEINIIPFLITFSSIIVVIGYLSLDVVKTKNKIWYSLLFLMIYLIIVFVFSFWL